MLKKFEKILEEILRKKIAKGEVLEPEEIKNITAWFQKEVSAELRDSYVGSKDIMLGERQKHEEFVQRNLSRWSRLFDLMDTLVGSVVDFGQNCAQGHTYQIDEKRDVYFSVVARLHALACRTTNEIICLLKNGFADAAHSRWRSLHELVVVANFIVQCGEECALAYCQHEVVNRYGLLTSFRDYEDRLLEQTPSEEEVERCKRQHDELIAQYDYQYGKEYGKHWGWAAPWLPTGKKGKVPRVTFRMLEEYVKLDHFRPYYAWASQRIHPMAISLVNDFATSESTENVILVGASDAGMAVPAHSTAVSLVQITSALSLLDINFDKLCHLEAFVHIEKEILKVVQGTMPQA